MLKKSSITKFSYLNFSRNFNKKEKNLGKAMSSWLNNKFNSVFRFLITSQDQSVYGTRLTKNMSKVVYSTYVKQRQK